jgi:hypothetical protein
LSSVVVKSIDEAAVRQAMDRYASRLLALHPEVEEVVLSGSARPMRVTPRLTAGAVGRACGSARRASSPRPNRAVGQVD